MCKATQCNHGCNLKFFGNFGQLPVIQAGFIKGDFDNFTVRFVVTRKCSNCFDDFKESEESMNSLCPVCSNLEQRIIEMLEK